MYVRTSNIIVARGSNNLLCMSLFKGLAPNCGLNPLLANQSSALGVTVTLISIIIVMLCYVVLYYVKIKLCCVMIMLCYDYVVLCYDYVVL